MPSLRNLKSSFHKQINNSLKFVRNVNNANKIGKITFRTEDISAVYEISFLKIFTAWERFLEDSFISYLEGKFSKKLKPKLITKRMGSDRAYQLLKGTRQYPDWTSVDNVIMLSTLFFLRNNPYDYVLRTTYQDVLQMKVIRNAITHVSKNSSETFKKLLRSELSSYSISMTPGEFLMQYKSPSEQYLSYYTKLLKSNTNFIVPL